MALVLKCRVLVVILKDWVLYLRLQNCNVDPLIPSYRRIWYTNCLALVFVYIVQIYCFQKYRVLYPRLLNCNIDLLIPNSRRVWYTGCLALVFVYVHTDLLFSEIPTPMAARTMKLVANSLIKLANLVDAKVCVSNLCTEICFIVAYMPKAVVQLSGA